MRIVFSLLSASLVALCIATSSLGENIKRYSAAEITKIYQESHWAYKRGDYRQAIRILKEIQYHEDDLIAKDIALLTIVDEIDEGNIFYKLDKAIELGMDRRSLYRELCKFVVEQAVFNMFRICASEVRAFVRQIDQKIEERLSALHAEAPPNLDNYQDLQQLVNRYELTFSMDEDKALVQRRILSKLNSQYCESRRSACGLGKESVLKLFEEVIY